MFFLWLPVLIGLVGAQETPAGCPKGLDPSYLQVFGRYCYEFAITQHRDYPSASNYCKVNGGTLAFIKDQATQNFVLKTLQEIYSGDNDFWIGLNDINKEGNYTWEDGTALSFEYWGSDDGPNNYFTAPINDCVAIDPYNGDWEDFHCESGLISIFYDVDIPYICQYLVPSE